METRASELARQYYETFQNGTRQEMESMIADDFTFTSPRDDHIDKAEFFVRCWPNRDQIKLQIENVVADGSDVFVRYRAKTKGDDFLNTEFLRIEDGKLKAVEVYFGSQ